MLERRRVRTKHFHQEEDEGEGVEGDGDGDGDGDGVEDGVEDEGEGEVVEDEVVEDDSEGEDEDDLDDMDTNGVRFPLPPILFSHMPGNYHRSVIVELHRRKPREGGNLRPRQLPEARLYWQTSLPPGAGRSQRARIWV